MIETVALVLAAWLVLDFALLALWCALVEVTRYRQRRRMAKGIHLQPTPDRERLGITTKRRGR